MIVVTGGAGFVGSNLVHALNTRGERDVVVVDDLSDARKVANLADAVVADYLDRADFASMVTGSSGDLGDVRAVLHQGARTSTLDDDGRGVMADNFGCSKLLLRWCRDRGIPLVYASSAAVYGAGSVFVEDEGNEQALNVYGWSKQLFDAVVRRELRVDGSQVVGLRYFNVYGPREDHKDSMSSIVAQLDRQARAGGPLQIFGAGCGRGPGEHRRDFVHIDDVVAVALWFLDHPDHSGIFNCGSGSSRSFNEVAELVARHHGGTAIEHVPFPKSISDRYQAETRADLTRLRDIGYEDAFTSVDDGVPRYLAWRDAMSPGRLG